MLLYTVLMLRIIFFSLLLLTSSCSETPPVEAIHANMDAVQLAIQEKDISGVMEHTLDSFIGNGHIDNIYLKKLLFINFHKHNNIHIVITRMDVEHDPKFPYHATMDGIVAVTGAENILPQDARILKVTGQWELHDGDWLLAKLDWE